MKIENPRCEVHSLYYNSDGSIADVHLSAGFTMGDYRYHCWITRDGSIKKDRRSMKRGSPEMQILYKNKKERGRNDKTAYLDAEAKANAPLIAELMGAISVPDAIAEYERNAKLAEVKAAADWRVAMIRETKQAAAEALFDALTETLGLLESFAPYERGELPIVNRAKAAIEAATLKVSP